MSNVCIESTVLHLKGTYIYAKTDFYEVYLIQ